MQCLRFVEQRFRIARKQTQLPTARNNLRKFHLVSSDKVLHDSSSILAGFFARHFESGEGPGYEVALDMTDDGAREEKGDCTGFTSFAENTLCPGP